MIVFVKWVVLLMYEGIVCILYGKRIINFRFSFVIFVMDVVFVIVVWFWSVSVKL